MSRPVNRRHRRRRPPSRARFPGCGGRCGSWDRFLDHHPLLEDQLRLDLRLTADRAFLESNPELRDFLHANPNVAEGLKIYPRYFLNRALMRQADSPVVIPRSGPVQGPVPGAAPELERDLLKNPEAIRDPAFLKSTRRFATSWSSIRRWAKSSSPCRPLEST